MPGSRDSGHGKKLRRRNCGSWATDQYLCIVPARGAAATGTAGTGGLFLPFEGDATLSVILSKAFLLADDTKITDPTIVSQIGR